MATNREPPEIARWTDRQLLTCFVARRDEAAFRALVSRHGPLVLGVCRRVLGEVHEADDAFQATFLVLARSAGTIRRYRSLASWLHGVAYRIASRLAKEKCRRMEPLPRDETEDGVKVFDQIAQRDEQRLVDEELNRLPDKDRHALTLRYLRDLSNEEIADTLAISVSAVEGRGKRAKERLRRRLTRRGISFGLFVAAVRQSQVEARAVDALVAETVGLVMSGGSAEGAAGSAAHELALAEIGEMAMSIKRILLVAALAIVATTAGWYGLSKAVVAQEPRKAVLVTSAAQQQPAGPETPTATISAVNSGNLSGAEPPAEARSDEADKRGAGQSIIKLYILEAADPERVTKALRPLVPDATIMADTKKRHLMVRASEEDQRRIAPIVDLIEESADRRAEGELSTQIYSLKFANPKVLHQLLTLIAPQATIHPDVLNRHLIVTATVKEHKRIVTVIDQADKPGAGQMMMEAYSLQAADPRRIKKVLKPLVPGVRADIEKGMVIVYGSDEDQKLAREILVAIDDHESENGTNVGPAEGGDADPEQMTDDELRRDISALTDKVEELSRRMKELEDSLKFRIVPADKG